MSYIPKRRISRVAIAAGLYTGKGGDIVKAFLKRTALKAWAAAPGGPDDMGAKSAKIVGAGHKGGTIPTEPFHFNVNVRDKRGNTIPIINPHTKKSTDTWHAYIGKNNDDLFAMAKSWYWTFGGKK